ncbi:hypothetical protein HK098_003376 [Nowakowskiella sp. JEL0407]|nr:hypothetical protein HK098_003376 [Nowakowskiella sp. JEL0407]
MKVVVVGQGRAGKTSLLRALREMRFNEDEKSTVHVNPVEIDQHFLENWKDCKKIAQLLKSVHSSVNDEASNLTRPNYTKEVPGMFSNIISPTPASISDDFTVLKNQKHVVSRSESKAIVKRLEDMHLKTPENENYTSKADLNSTTLAIYDFAGQSLYSVFQQIFITAQAIYLVVFRLDAMFTDKNLLNQNELRIVLSWLNTIYLRAPQSRILLVGTQCDAPSIFITSAKTKYGVEGLRNAIDKSVQLSVSELEQKPVDWIRFQDKLVELVNNKKASLTSTISEVMKIAIEFRISDREELEAVLRYFHTIGVVLYFPKNTYLREIVFPDPQAVVNVISTVFKYHDNPPARHEVSRGNLKALEELRTNKVWMRSLLDELWGQHLSSNDVAALFALLKEFDLLCDIKPLIASSNNSNIAQNTISIMPCLLSDKVVRIDNLV